MSLGTAFIDIRADTAGFNASLAAGLKAALGSAQAQANVSFKAIATSAATAARGTSEAFVAASRDIAASVAAASAGVDQALARNAQRAQIIQATGSEAAAALARDFGLAASAGTAAFQAAGRQVAAAIAFAVEQGEKSLLRLATRAALAAEAVESSLRLAAQGIQGPMRVATDAIAKDLFDLAKRADVDFADIVTAGNITAAKLAESLGIAAGQMTAEIDAAALNIATALGRAANAGETSFVRLSTVLAEAATVAETSLVSALNAITAAEIRAGTAAEVLTAKLNFAARTAAASLTGELGAAFTVIAGDLSALGALGALKLSDVALAGRRVAAELEAEFGPALGLVTADFAAMTAAALRDFGLLVSSGTATAAELDAAFATAIGEIVANLRELQGASTKTFTEIATEAKASAAKVGAAFKDAASVSNAAILGIAGTARTAFLGAAAAAGIVGTVVGVLGLSATARLEQIKIAFDGIIQGQKEFQGNLAAGQAASAKFFADLKTFAKLTPFQFPELADASQRLLAIGLNGQQTLNVLNDIGNAVSAVGGNGENLKKVVLAIGQINSYTKVTADNLNQISNALPNFNRKAFAATIAELRAVKERGDGATATTKELSQATQDLHNGAVASGEGIAALLKTLREAPGAEGAMIRQSLTLAGVLSNLKDSARFSLTDAFSKPEVLDVFKNALITLQGTLNDFLSTIAPAIGSIIAGLDPLVNGLLPVLGDALVPIFEIFGKLLAIISPVLNAIVSGFGEVFTALGPGLETLAGALSDAFLQVLPDLTDAIVGLIPELVALAEALLPILPAIVSIIAGGLQVLGPLLAALTPTIELLVAAFVKFLSIPGVAEVLGAIALAMAAVLAVIGPLTAAVELVAGAMVAFELIAGAVGVAIAAIGGPVLVAIAVIAALAVGVVYLYKRFETARDIIGKVGTVILTGIKFWVAGAYTAITGFVEAVLRAFRLMAAAIGKIPIIGRPFDKAAAGIDAAIDSIDAVRDAILSIPTDVTTHINIVVNETTLRDASNVGSTAALENEFNQEKQLRRVAAQAAAEKAASDKRLADRLKRVVTGGGGAGFEPGGTVADTAADKANKAAADRISKFRDAIAAILLKLDEDFKSGLIHDSAEQIKKTLQGIAKDIAAAFDDAGKPRPNKLLVRIKADTAELRKLAVERDAVTKRLEAATQKAADIANGVRSFANVTSLDFSAAVLGAANAVAKLNITTLDVAGSFQVVSRTLDTTAAAASEQVKHTGEDFAAALKARLAAIEAFQADIDALIAKGVRRSLIDQILGAGVEGGAEAADALANANAATIAGINKTQDAINAAAKKLGDTAAENFFRVGGQVVEGLIQGLKDRKSEIAKEMTEIATSLITAIRKTLKTASPSKVTRAIGQFVTKGLALGLHDRVGDVLAASARVAQAATPTFAPIGLGAITAAGEAQAVAVMRQQLGAQGTSTATSQITNNHTREINAPITQNFHGGGMTPASAMAAMNAAVARGLRG